MADTKLRSLKATLILRDDHRRVKQLFSDLESLGVEGDSESKMELFEEIKHELEAHAAIEDEIFYPAVERLQGDEEEAEKIVSDAREAHQMVKKLLDELSRLDAADDSWDGKIQVLAENVEQHAEEEEEIMFPLFDKLPQGRRNQIADELRARKAELLEEEEEDDGE